MPRIAKRYTFVSDIHLTEQDKKFFIHGSSDALDLLNVNCFDSTKSPNDLKVLKFILSHYSRKAQSSYPSVDFMSRTLSICHTTITRCTNALHKCGLIKKVSDYEVALQRTRNYYVPNFALLRAIKRLNSTTGKIFSIRETSSRREKINPTYNPDGDYGPKHEPEPKNEVDTIKGTVMNLINKSKRQVQKVSGTKVSGKKERKKGLEIKDKNQENRAKPIKSITHDMEKTFIKRAREAKIEQIRFQRQHQKTKNQQGPKQLESETLQVSQFGKDMEQYNYASDPVHVKRDYAIRSKEAAQHRSKGTVPSGLAAARALFGK